MSFLDNTFENDSLNNDFEIDEDIANKEEFIERSSDTEKEGSEIEIKNIYYSRHLLLKNCI